TAAGADLRRGPHLIGTGPGRSKRVPGGDPTPANDMFARGGLRGGEEVAQPRRGGPAGTKPDVAGGGGSPPHRPRRGSITLDVTYISAITGMALISRRQTLLPNSAVEEQRFPWEPPVED